MKLLLTNCQAADVLGVKAKYLESNVEKLGLPYSLTPKGYKRFALDDVLLLLARTTKTETTMMTLTLK